MAKEYTLPDLVEAIVEHSLWDLHTCLPAKIVTIDYEQQKATVQPLIKERNRDAKANDKGLQDMPVIQGVPVIFPSANTGILTFPIKAGDIVLVVFSERSVDNFVFSDGVNPVDPDDFRKHNYTDAFCIAGLYPFKKALGIHPSDAVLRMNVDTANECSVSLKPNGDVIVDTPTKFIVNAANEVEINTELVTVNASNEVIVNTAIATVNASDSVTIDSPQTTCTGELRVDGGVSIGSDVQTDAGFSGNTHVHIGNLSKPTSVFV